MIKADSDKYLCEVHEGKSQGIGEVKAWETCRASRMPCRVWRTPKSWNMTSSTLQALQQHVNIAKCILFPHEMKRPLDRNPECRGIHSANPFQAITGRSVRFIIWYSNLKQLQAQDSQYTQAKTSRQEYQDRH